VGLLDLTGDDNAIIWAVMVSVVAEEEDITSDALLVRVILAWARLPTSVINDVILPRRVFVA
jgi:hypothetical protein